MHVYTFHKRQNTKFKFPCEAYEAIFLREENKLYRVQTKARLKTLK